mmetsp:Transcript_25235/g.47191  ORF Transcript_25235/g.47191 Transcript_25235/m.47191 type:complete len:362 (+) Transcript_25235:1996-3081(+)
MKNKAPVSSTDGLMKLAVIVAVFSVLLFAALTAASGGSNQMQTQTQTLKQDGSRVIPKYANPEGKPMEAEDGCEDRSNQCQSYAARGECDRAIGWMVVNCPVSCGTCHLRDAKVRCDRDVLNISHTKALEPNTLHTIFNRLESDLSSKYKVDVHSRSPFVVTIDDFMTSEEADALIKSGGVKWERSTDTGTSNKFGETGRILTEKRTSSNSWCREECLANPLVQNIVKKIRDVTMIDDVNYESFQVLRYENGQFYNAHHDTGQSQFSLSCGQRILTFFLYLSDVEEGGETSFPLLNISVIPKKGKALIWPGVHNDNPMAIDDRTLHEAQPVIKGLKYAANTWIHQYDFKTSNTWGCTGTFE